MGLFFANTMKKFLSQNKRAIYGGLISSFLIGLGVFLLGNVSGYEAKQLLSASLPGINMLCNTIILASATILALLLTLLGISSGIESKLKDKHYYEVLNIAKIDTIVFVVVLILFQLLNIPVTEADSVPTRYYRIIYWASLLISSIVSGAMVVVILMLYNTVSNIIYIVGLGRKHPLLQDDGKDEPLEDEQEKKG